MDVVRVLLLDPLVQQRQEVGHQVDVLEDDPLAADEGSLQQAHGKADVLGSQGQVLYLNIGSRIRIILGLPGI